MEYKVFRKTVKSKGGKSARWYYCHWLDAAGNQHQKVCYNIDGKPARNRSEAENYIRSIPPPEAALQAVPLEGQDVTIGAIAAEMYIPASAHVKRREQLGKSTEAETMTESRRYIKAITDIFGTMRLRDLTVEHVMGYLFPWGLIPRRSAAVKEGKTC
jgi:hypothetical protein